MYTLKDIVSNNLILLNETQLLDLDDVNGVTINFNDDEKVVKVHIGLYNYLFGRNIKKRISEKVKKDLGSKFVFKFVI